MTDTAEIEFRDYYTESLYMTTDLETGVLYNRSGRRMIALTDDFLIGLHKALEAECGEKADQVLAACGRRWGKYFATGLDDEWSQFYGQPAKNFPAAMFHSLLVQEFGHNGWGNIQLHYDHFEQGVLWVSLEGAIMSDIYPTRSERNADVLTTGILAGIFQHFFERELDCLQTQCSAGGHDLSCFVLSSPSRIDSVRELVTTGKPHQEVLTYLHQQCG
jgi:predicted hydrocarbon binding protein